MLDVAVDEEAIARLADHLVLEHENLLKALVAMRKKHKLTQAQVAERMGVSQPTVASFERYDSNPTLATIRRYALAVDARIHEKVKDDCVERASARFANVVEMDDWTPRRPLQADWTTPRVSHG